MADGLSGSLTELPLRHLLKMLAAGEQTGRLELNSGLELAALFLRTGVVVHATADAASGDAAVSTALGWTNGSFRFEPGVLHPEVTITAPLEQLLAEGSRQVSEREMLQRVIPSPEVVPRLAAKLPADSISISAAEWEVLAQIDGAATVGQLARTLGRSDLEAVRAFYSLKISGLIELSVEPARPVAVVLAGKPFFQALQTAVAAAMGPLAEIIIDDALEDIGFTRRTLPRSEMSAVAERISREIRESENRSRFQQTMLAALRSHAA